MERGSRRKLWLPTGHIFAKPWPLGRKMHELSLALNLLDLAEAQARQAGATTIRTVGLRVGALSGVMLEALESAFEGAKKGTLADQARLEVERVGLAALCQNCQCEFAVDDPHAIAVCPTCHRPSATLVRGVELQMMFLDVD